jgi:CPA1 family monovalent cation:H+ antiporter
MSPEPNAGDPPDHGGSAHRDLHRRAIQAARQAVHALRAADEIGDDAFHEVEEELDWLEMADGTRNG